MFGFQYEYIKTSEIFEKMLKISEYGMEEFTILIIGILFTISSVFYIIPLIKIYFKNIQKEKDKRMKKRMIDKIVLQKNLEDLVMREVNEKNVNN